MGKIINSVVIDPGHGGPDLGAIGPALRIKEKDVVLSLGLDLGKLLVNDGRRVVFTRDKDVSVFTGKSNIRGTDIQELDARCAIANSSNADLFISLHCNSAVQSANGVEVFYYSDRGKGIARTIQKNLVTLLKTNNRDARQSDLYLLARVKMIAISINVAFISNRREEIKLTDKMFLKKITVSIAKSLIEKTL